MTKTYDRTTILFHWITAGLVVAMWLIPQFIDDVPVELRIYPRSLHILLGMVLIVVVMMRIAWRLTSGTYLPAMETGLMKWAAQAAHYGLYALIIATLVLGTVYELARADTIVNLGRLPSIAPGDRSLIRQLGGLHGTAANALLILAGLHAAAALFHHFILRDTTLRRMLG